MVEAENPHYVIEVLLSIYTSLILIIGIPGNALSGFILSTDRALRKTTRFLMGTLAVADTIVLLIAVTRYWVNVMFDKDPRDAGELICKTHVFAVAFSTDFAVGALCAVSVERYLVVAFPQKAASIVRLPFVILGMFLFALSVAIKNGIHFVIMGKWLWANNTLLNSSSPEATKATMVFVCKTHEDYANWTRIFMKADFISFAILPYVILFSCNLYIFCVLRRQRRLLNNSPNAVVIKVPQIIVTTPGELPEDDCEAKTHVKLSIAGNEQTSFIKADSAALSERKWRWFFGLTLPRKMSKYERKKRKPEDVIKVLTALTVVHVFCTLPGTIFTLLYSYFHVLPSLDEKTNRLIKFFLVMIIFTNNAINFFAYLASSERFRQRVSELLCKCFKGGFTCRHGNDCAVMKVR
ncbi:hypothetical protein AAHC03_09209 [Spirometra sp. Aus1]